MAKSKRRPTGARPSGPKPTPDERAARAAERERRVAEREAAKRRAAAQMRRRRWIRSAAVVAAVGLVLGVLGYRIIDRRRTISRIVASSATASRAASCGDLQAPSTAGRDHIAPDKTGAGYTSNPPTSGPHFTSTSGTGVLDAPVEDQRLIHNLEHGGVVIHHRDLPADELAELTAKVRELDEAKVLLVPNPKLPKDIRVAYTGWRRLQSCEKYDATVLDTFLRLYLSPNGKDVGAPEKDQPL